MLNKNITIGMKVVPHDKTAGASGLETSTVWKEAKKSKQPYLYVVYDHFYYYALSESKCGAGDFLMLQILSHTKKLNHNQYISTQMERKLLLLY
jgi:hypothetical protein